MKNAAIFHGISSTPDKFWFPYLKKELEKRYYNVWVPQLPQSADPDITIQVPWILKNYNFDKDTVLIGHSSGASLIFALLEKLDTKVKQVITVSCFIIPEGTLPPKAIKKKWIATIGKKLK